MFSKATFAFLDELAANNDRAWFEANKPRYEELVREPALEFIAAMAVPLAKFAPHFRAEPRKMGGSLMRVFRDTRFSRDKTPYKTNIGIQFRHELGKDVHAPGFYLHIATDECFFGAGSWHPEADLLGRIRDHITENPKRWFAVRDDKKFRRALGAGRRQPDPAAARLCRRPPGDRRPQAQGLHRPGLAVLRRGDGLRAGQARRASALPPLRR
jgi:uncharacterized protein (TIGR02453 family)